MCMESEALKEISGLKSVIANYRNGLTVSQTIKRSNIALLNKLRDKFINSNHSCEHELLDMINSLELEK